MGPFHVVRTAGCEARLDLDAVLRGLDPLDRLMHIIQMILQFVALISCEFVVGQRMHARSPVAVQPSSVPTEGQLQQCFTESQGHVRRFVEDDDELVEIVMGTL